MSQQNIDLNRIQPSTDDEENAVLDTLDNQYTYHPFSEAQTKAAHEVRDNLKSAAYAIIKNAPPSADRSAALRKLREARMDANSAIAHGGKY
jgi:hypothetical protein